MTAPGPTGNLIPAISDCEACLKRSLPCYLIGSNKRAVGYNICRDKCFEYYWSYKLSTGKDIADWTITYQNNTFPWECHMCRRNVNQAMVECPNCHMSRDESETAFPFGCNNIKPCTCGVDSIGGGKHSSWCDKKD